MNFVYPQNMIIHQVGGTGYDSNIYLIEGKYPTLIDTGTGSHFESLIKSIKRHIDPKEIEIILLTHEHFDHCGGVKKLKEITNAKILIHKD